MRRREFIAGLGSAAAVWPLAEWAQTVERVRRILAGISNSSISGAWVSAFVQRLGELGWIEGRNVSIAYRWMEASPRGTAGAEIAAIAPEFVRMKVDVIYVAATDTVLLAKRATSVMPIVFAVAADLVRLGIVDSLARPGGNVTGLTNQLAELKAA